MPHSPGIVQGQVGVRHVAEGCETQIDNLYRVALPTVPIGPLMFPVESVGYPRQVDLVALDRHLQLPGLAQVSKVHAVSDGVPILGNAVQPQRLAWPRFPFPRTPPGCRGAPAD